MGYNVGLNVVEVDGSGAPAIVGASTSVAAFNISTQRGVARQAIAGHQLRAVPHELRRLRHIRLGAYLVKGFFDNGGQTAYINRVVSSDASAGDLAAHLVLADGRRGERPAARRRHTRRRRPRKLGQRPFRQDRPSVNLRAR